MPSNKTLEGVWMLTEVTGVTESGKAQPVGSTIKLWTFKRDGIGYENNLNPFIYEVNGDNLIITLLPEMKKSKYSIKEFTDKIMVVQTNVPKTQYTEGYTNTYYFSRIE